MSKFWGHLSTITKHRHLVMFMCFKCGMFKQGLKHDLSKYSFEEFIPSVRYFQGDKSPITYEKKLKGYSECWFHHKGRNKHHWEYWTDRVGNKLVPFEMPFNYLLECVIDKISASKIYQKDKYNENYPIEFFNKSFEKHVMHPETSRQIEYFLTYLQKNGEDKTLAYIKDLYKKWKKDSSFKI